MQASIVHNMEHDSYHFVKCDCNILYAPHCCHMANLIDHAMLLKKVRKDDKLGLMCFLLNFLESKHRKMNFDHNVSWETNTRCNNGKKIYSFLGNQIDHKGQFMWTHRLKKKQFINSNNKC
uniref:Uncharacterized protein n=1 Tax=Nelumbo nucifera TaxID=4432 RepID=A0A822YN54_NELNU|nr:TPA_asm: hypothetical protein HUJ06_011296 [Nelumbo nucifera]